MHIDVIEGREAFADIRHNWDAVCDADPDGNFFMSWTWLSRWMDGMDKPWFILAARQHPAASTYVAFLPVAVWTRQTKAGFHSEIAMAGNRLSDYAGIIALPQFLPQAVRAFAAHLKRLTWATLNLENIRLSEEHIGLLLESFPTKAFEITRVEHIDPRDNLNHSVCPYITLPNDWDRYLDGIGSNSRQKARRFLRKVDAGELRITHADAATFPSDLETMLHFWALKWGPRKGPRLPGLVKMNRAMLTHCFASGCLFMPVLWQGDRPLGALAIIIDRPKKSLLFFIGARDETVSTPPPGFVLHAYAIRHAIHNGFTTYDFLRGNEPYKYLFASQERPIRHVVVSTIDGRNRGGRLDRRSVPAVLEMTRDLHEAGRLEEAERGYRQVLEVEPRDPTALYGLGRVMASRGNHRAAERLFRALLAVRPDSAKAWFKLGRSLQARQRLSDAVSAYHEVIRHSPEFPLAYYNLGETLRALGCDEEAAAALQEAEALERRDAEAVISAASALQLASRLPWDARAPHPLLRADLERSLGRSGAPAAPAVRRPAKV